MAGALRLVVTRQLPEVAQRQLEALRGVSLVQWPQSNAAPPREWLEAHVPDAAGLLCLLTDRIDAPLLDRAGSGLKVVSTMSVGYDHVDVGACSSRGVAVGNTPGVLDGSTAELAVALTLATTRRLFEGAAHLRSGTVGPWSPLQLCGSDMEGATVGIVGLGRIGARYARIMSAFGCRVLYTGPRPKEDVARPIGAEFRELDALLEESDVVSLHCPLNDTTRGLISADQLRRMGPDTVLINTSRGPVVDQDALFNALYDGVIRAAGLDVTVPEPLPPSHPLLSLPNAVVLPHLGSSTVATRTAMAQIAVSNLIAGTLGEGRVAAADGSARLPHQVNSDVALPDHA